VLVIVLYVSQQIKDGEKQAESIPEGRPSKKEREIKK